MQGGVELGGDVGVREPEPRRRGGVEPHAQLRGVALEAGIQVDQSRHRLDPCRDLLRLHLEGRIVGAEELDLQRPWRPGEIIEDILQHLDELDARLRHGVGHALPRRGDHLFGRARAVAARLEANHDVAAADLGGGGRTQLGTRAAGVRGHLGQRAQDGFDLACDGVRVGANAVVLQDIPAHHTAVGIPARAIPRALSTFPERHAA